MYVPKYFELYELLPKDWYINQFKNWYIFDPRMLITLDKLRERYGRLTANDWHWGKNNQYRGWRPFNCKVGAEFSQHKFGRAVDLVSQDTDVYEIRKDIIKDPFCDDFKYITCVEDDIPWLHIDCRNYHKEKLGLLIIKP